MTEPFIVAFSAVQGWLFESVVQPAMFALGLMAYADPTFDALETAMIGVIEIVVLYLLLRPLEAWRPVEAWQSRRAVRSDVAYTWLNRIGVLPLLLFVLLVPLVDGVDGWLRMHDVIPPTLEDLLPIQHNSFAAFVLYLVILDGVQYAIHRMQHRFDWWWALHSLHHSQRQLSFWADNRNHLLDDLIGTVLLTLVALAIGVAPTQFMMIVIFTRMVESLSHVNARVSFGPFGERLLVSPRFHRAHHAIGVGHEGAQRGCNFAVLFPFWDLLFRTAHYSARFYPTGITDQLEGRDYGEGLIRQQWLGLVRLVRTLAPRRA